MLPPIGTQTIKVVLFVQIYVPIRSYIFQDNSHKTQHEELKSNEHEVERTMSERVVPNQSDEQLEWLPTNKWSWEDVCG